MKINHPIPGLAGSNPRPFTARSVILTKQEGHRQLSTQTVKGIMIVRAGAVEREQILKRYIMIERALPPNKAASAGPASFIIIFTLAGGCRRLAGGPRRGAPAGAAPGSPDRGLRRRGLRRLLQRFPAPGRQPCFAPFKRRKKGNMGLIFFRCLC